MKPIALIGLVALAACAAAPDEIPGADAVIDMTTSLNFSSETLSVPVGSTVAWRNTSFFAHTVTANPATAAHPGDISLPDGARGFEADLPGGAVFRHTFTVPGTYRYYCDPHHGAGMTGTVVVTE